ncbi:MAG: hypothetical protein L3J00_00265 [Thiomicrorhabdus sp.]|nr:hypothetical protein [Thiomicrorhabdus sp.]
MKYRLPKKRGGVKIQSKFPPPSKTNPKANIIGRTHDAVNALTPSTQTQLDPKDDLNKTRYCSEGNPQSHQDMDQLLKAQENEDINTPYSEKPLTEPNKSRPMGRNKMARDKMNKRKNKQENRP